MRFASNSTSSSEKSSCSLATSSIHSVISRTWCNAGREHVSDHSIDSLPLIPVLGTAALVEFHPTVMQRNHIPFAVEHGSSRRTSFRIGPVLHHIVIHGTDEV